MDSEGWTGRMSGGMRCQGCEEGRHGAQHHSLIHKSSHDEPLDSRNLESKLNGCSHVDLTSLQSKGRFVVSRVIVVWSRRRRCKSWLRSRQISRMAFKSHEKWNWKSQFCTLIRRKCFRQNASLALAYSYAPTARMTLTKSEWESAVKILSVSNCEFGG